MAFNLPCRKKLQSSKQSPFINNLFTFTTADLIDYFNLNDLTYLNAGSEKTLTLFSDFINICNIALHVDPSVITNAMNTAVLLL